VRRGERPFSTRSCPLDDSDSTVSSALEVSMATRPLGTIKYRPFAYFLLLVAAGLVGVTGSVLFRLALEPLATQVDQTGFWPDFVRGGLVTISAAPCILAVLAGRRLISRFWTVLPG
jgi:hypothetical protein